MNRHIKVWHFAMLLVFSIAWSKKSVAQGFDPQEVTIISDYKARIEQADKISYVPRAEQPSMLDSNLSYEIPDKLIKLDYEPAELKPLGTPKEKLKRYPASYIKLGFGNRITPLAEIVYNETSLQNTTVGAYYKHLSSSGKRENQKFSSNTAGAYLTQYFDKFKFGASFDYERDVHHFYGYDPDSFSFDSKDVRQRLRTFQGGLDFGTATVNSTRTEFSQDFNFRHSSTLPGDKEQAYIGTTAVKQRILNYHSVSADFTFNINRLDFVSGTQLNRNVFNFGGEYRFNNDDWDVSAGFEVAFDDTCVFFFPRINFSKRLFEQKLIFYAGWNTQLEVNTLYSLTQQNPYLQTNPEIRNARVEDRMAGFKGSFKTVTYDLRFSNKVIRNMPLYVNDTNDFKRFVTVYDPKLSVFNVHLGFAMDIKKNLTLGLTTDFNVYSPSDSVSVAWHMPTFNMNFYAKYNFKNKVLVRADILAVSGAQAREIDGSVVTLKGTADVSLEAEYIFSKYFSAFVQLNNLGSINYQRYLNYPSFGFIGIIGARFSY